MTTTRAPVSGRTLLWAAFFTAAGVLAFEIALLRLLLVASWHHFAFLIISVALLGFGASGTALLLFRRFLLARPVPALLALLSISAACMPLCTAVAQHLPVEARLVPALLWRQIGCWIAYWSVLTLPFFFGAGALGLALMLARQNVARIYAANLIGSATGCLVSPAVMCVVPPAWLPVVSGGVTLIGTVALLPAAGRWARVAPALAVAATAVWMLFDPPEIRVDPYKYGAYVDHLEDQGAACKVAVAYGPRALLEAYSGNTFHDLPFLTGDVSPPAMTVLLADGHPAGSLLDLTHPDQAAMLEHTITAVAYALAPTAPGVALLGEQGGSNVWLALRHDSRAVDVVQPNPDLFYLLRGPLRALGGAVIDLPGVRSVTSEPRHFVDHTTRQYDLIQLVSLEGLPAGSGGLGGLGQNHLMTVEGIRSCLERLTAGGLLAVTRGIQEPPRDNLKILSTFVAALRRYGIGEPQAHIVVLRDFLAVCTIAKATPWTPDHIRELRRVIQRRNLTPVWFPGVRAEELNQPDVFETAPTGVGDWYHHAAVSLFGPQGEAFVRDWSFDIRPPTDDRPFFQDFFKWRTVALLQQAFGPLWLTRTELAFLFVIAVTVLIGAGAVLLTLAPLWAVADVRRARGRAATAAYFAAIGLAYLFLEITLLSRLTQWIGDPVTAASVTISGFLLFSGLGSLSVSRRQDIAGFRVVVLALLVVGLLELALAGPLAVAAGSLPLAVRCVAALAAVAPLAYLMGFPMATALALLDRAEPALVPWAWGVNGFASVMAAPLATAIGMTWGFSVAGVAALLLYASCARSIIRFPTAQHAA